eukprot:gene30122-14195_t
MFEVHVARWLPCTLAVVCVHVGGTLAVPPGGVAAPCGPATAYGAVGDGTTLNDGALAAALA